MRFQRWSEILESIRIKAQVDRLESCRHQYIVRILQHYNLAVEMINFRRWRHDFLIGELPVINIAITGSNQKFVIATRLDALERCKDKQIGKFVRPRLVFLLLLVCHQRMAVDRLVITD